MEALQEADSQSESAASGSKALWDEVRLKEGCVGAKLEAFVACI